MANEKRLIDANDVYALFDANGFARLHVGDIDTIPRVDAVEVVRCKDCKHFVQGEPYDPCECVKWKVRFGVAYTTPDGYCHKAERKTENP